MENHRNNNVGKVLVMFIAITFLLMGFAGGSQMHYDETLQVNNILDKNLIDATGNIDVRISISRNADVKKISGQLENIGVTINRINTVSVNYFECTIDADMIDKISQMNGVTWVQQTYEPQTLLNNIESNTFMGADTPQLNGFTGSGILAEVIDNGCDFSHTDLDAIQYTEFSPGVGDHGTCVSGIMFGDGTGDANAQGHLPDAIGVFGEYLNGNAIAISNLWDGTFQSGNAGQHGVIQTNSWWNGATMDGEYDAMSNELDQAIVDHPNVLTHWAIGNSNFGTTEGLMSAESISKNNMAVGAIYHQNTASTADDDWSSNGNGNTPSRGPAADGRAKPDMLGTFDWIYCTDWSGSSGYTTTDYYNDFGGTSGATPTVAGCSGLAYEMYQENYFDNNPTGDWPYSCTIKAMMIADAFQYPMNTNLITRNVQGWGSPDMENMYDLGPDYHVIEEYPQALSSGDSWSRGVFSDGVNPLKITLAWIDPAAPSSTIAGRALINNLDLHVTSPGGTQYWGNNGLGYDLYSSSGTGAQRWSSTSSYRDDLNNVENVFILNPEVGVWTVEVLGRTGDVAQGPQDFSLVASGATGISSMGIIDIAQDIYRLEDTVSISLTDMDLNTDSGTTQIVIIDIDSDTEFGFETVTLTETGVDTSTFEGTKLISAIDAVGILQVSNLDTITATYYDADDGTGSPAVATDTAIVDGSPPGSPTALTVDWWGSGHQVLFTDDFEDGDFSDWTTGGASNDWQIGTPAGLGGNYGNADPNSAASGTYSIGNDLTGIGSYPGDYETNLATNSNWIYSPPIDCSGTTNVELFFQRYLNVEQPLYDHAYIEVSDDASSWNEVWTNTATIADSSWGEVNYDISTWADNQPTVYVRFEVGSSDGSWQYCGWNIDDFRIEGDVAGATTDNLLNWTLSSDDGAGDNDVVVYNIYRANNPGGPWDITAYWDSVPAGIDTYMDLGRGEFDGTTWWYIVRAEDLGGNEDTNSVAVPEPGAVVLAPYDIDISGASIGDWVFISFPYAMSGPIETVLDDSAYGGGGTDWNVAKWYDAQDAADPWKTYRYGSSTNDLITIDNQMGVWVHLTATDGTLTTGLTGDYAAGAVNIDLYTGWNLVSYPSATNRLASTTLPGEANLVAYYDGGATYLISDALPNTVTFSEGNAYWVHVTSDTLWSVDP